MRVAAGEAAVVPAELVAARAAMGAATVVDDIADLYNERSWAVAAVDVKTAKEKNMYFLKLSRIWLISENEKPLSSFECVLLPRSF